jgi:hypothetical protein
MQFCCTAWVACCDVHSSEHTDLTAELSLLCWSTRGNTSTTEVGSALLTSDILDGANDGCLVIRSDQKVTEVRSADGAAPNRLHRAVSKQDFGEDELRHGRSDSYLGLPRHLSQGGKGLWALQASLQVNSAPCTPVEHHSFTALLPE